jgi:hypothetical protein
MGYLNHSDQGFWEQAEAEGKQFIVKKELAEAWDQFSANPCYDTAVRLVVVAPNMLPYFDGSFQKSQHSAIWTAITFSFKHYRLPNKTTDIKGLRELSQQVHGFFPLQFIGEVIYNATPIRFMGDNGNSWFHQFMGKFANGQRVLK